jgi:hypothetical protein
LLPLHSQYGIFKKHLIPAIIIVVASSIDHSGGAKLFCAKYYKSFRNDWISPGIQAEG